MATKGDDSTRIAIRVSGELLSAIDAEAIEMTKRVPGHEFTRSDAARAMLIRGSKITDDNIRSEERHREALRVAEGGCQHCPHAAHKKPCGQPHATRLNRDCLCVFIADVGR